ncbi:MAG: hypothetical protein ACLPKW_14830 [Acetobacteraceae bacterium]
MTTPTLDAKASGSFSSATSNSSAPLSILPTIAGDWLIVLVSASVNLSSGGSSLSVSTITATGTGAPTSFTKITGLSFFGGAASGDYPACVEAWLGKGTTASAWSITVTMNQSIDDACINMAAITGAASIDSGTSTTNTEAIATTSHPVITGITSSGSSLFVLFAETAGSSTLTSVGAPTNIVTSTLETTTNVGAVNDNSLFSYYGTSTGSLSAQTITSRDTANTTHGNANWGALVVAVSSSAASDSATITTSLGSMAQVFEATLVIPAGITTVLGHMAQVFDVRDADLAAIITSLGQFSQVAAVTPRISGNTAFASWWTISP